MTDISVRCDPAGEGWLCTGSLSDVTGSSGHRVAVRPADVERYAPGAVEPTDLVRRSFEFLLAREPRSSILPEFDLPVIGRYFPEYEAAIRRGVHPR